MTVMPLELQHHPTFAQLCSSAHMAEAARATRFLLLGQQSRAELSTATNFSTVIYMYIYLINDVHVPKYYAAPFDANNVLHGP